MEEIPKTVYITSHQDLNKLRVNVVFESVEYQPSSRRTIAKLTVSLVFPDTDYYYGGRVKIHGNAMNSKVLRFKFEGEKGLSGLSGKMLLEAQKELDQIKREIMNILSTGVERVSIELNETLERILSKLWPQKGS